CLRWGGGLLGCGGGLPGGGDGFLGWRHDDLPGSVRGKTGCAHCLESSNSTEAMPTRRKRRRPVRSTIDRHGRATTSLSGVPFPRSQFATAPYYTRRFYQNRTSVSS